MTDKYIQLLLQFPPRTITNDQELSATQARIDRLLDRQELSPEESDYLNVLGALVFEYEQSIEPIPDIYGVELLKVLIQERELRQKDLCRVSRYLGSYALLVKLNLHRRLLLNQKSSRGKTLTSQEGVRILRVARALNCG